MSKHRVALLLLAGAVAFAAPVFADGDPTMQQIYDEAKAGHLDRAQTMINQVLKDHPRSAKAHYVAAELASKEGNLTTARSELAEAEQLDPGLPFAKPAAVQELKAQLSPRARTQVLAAAPERHSFPWVAVLLIGGVIVLVWMALRRRNPPPAVQYPGGAYSGMPGGGTPAPYGGPGGYGAPQGGGIGSSIAGGLASGLAVGAGVVAGEEIARHFLDGGHHEGGATAAPVYSDEPPPNADLGGNDFGVNDPGSWDDSGGGFGGGGDGGGDWS